MDASQPGAATAGQLRNPGGSCFSHSGEAPTSRIIVISTASLFRDLRLLEAHPPFYSGVTLLEHVAYLYKVL